MAKPAAMCGVVLVLWMGLGSVEGLVDERMRRQAEAQQSVAAAHAGEQVLVGPLLQRECKETWVETKDKGEGKERSRHAQEHRFAVAAWPKRVELQAQVDIEPRQRGLFRSNTYLARQQLKADWADLKGLEPKARHEGGVVSCEEPLISFAVSDARGLAEVVAQVSAPAAIAATAASATAGTTPLNLGVSAGSRMGFAPAGFHLPLSLAGRGLGEPLSLNLQLSLGGTQRFSLVPLGQQNQVRMASAWPHPSFGGRFLPATRQVSDSGFDATWHINALATQAQARVLHPQEKCARAECLDAFSVDFIDPVNTYVLSDRALKYGMLFIGLTFAFVGMAELLRRARVHPMQYLLAGAALSVFFLLLLSLSEHLPFAAAYGLAAAACTVLLAYHGRHCLGNWRLGSGFGAAMAGLYGALYLLLQLEQTALVLGAVLLFVVLTAVIVATRKVDWYGLSRPAAGSAEAPEGTASV